MEEVRMGTFFLKPLMENNRSTSTALEMLCYNIELFYHMPNNSITSSFIFKNVKGATAMKHQLK